MKTKVIGLLVAIAIAVLAFTGTANALNLHIVKKGDTLSAIAKKYNVGLNEVKKVNRNNVKNPNLIYPGQEIVLPDSNDEFSYENPGADKYRGTLDEALKLLQYPEKAVTILKEKVARGEFEWTIIKVGDRFAMTFGKNKVRFNTVAAWKDENILLAAKKYTVTVDNTVYTLLYPLYCGNWSRVPDLKITEKVIEEIIPAPIPEIKAEPPKFMTPKIIQKLQLVQKVVSACSEIEHEPIIGAGTWTNGLAKGNFAYGEYLLWLKAKCGSEYSMGAGIYGNWENGDSKISAYEWDGSAIGLQIGLKRSYSYTNDEDERFLQQWVGKIRLAWEHTEGRNSESGYAMSQNNLKLGGYGEYVRQLDDKWTGILTGEGWYALQKSINSTWSGDKPANRTQLMAGLYGQYKINDNWQTRFGGGPFYQGWDKMTGMHLRAELRWKETIMFGPYANLFLFGKSSIYEAIATSDLQTYGAFIRIEFGKIIRDWDEKRRMDRIRKLHEELYPIDEPPATTLLEPIKLYPIKDIPVEGEYTIDKKI